jgi:hypothetical protein
VVILWIWVILVAHIWRSCVEEFLRQLRVESLQNSEFYLGPDFIPLRNVDQSQIVVRSGVVAFEADGIPQRFDRSRQATQLEIGKT